VANTCRTKKSSKFRKNRRCANSAFFILLLTNITFISNISLRSSTAYKGGLMSLILVDRTTNPPLAKRPRRKLTPEVIGDDQNVIVIHGNTRRVPTYTNEDGKEAVNTRFLRTRGLRWKKTEGAWCSNGDKGQGKIVIGL
jgi:hypothetical protein